MSSIVTNWLFNIFWFVILYAAYKMYRKYKARPPKHSWDSNAFEWVWKDGKPVRKATLEEYQLQSSGGCLFSFDIDSPNRNR